MGDYNHTDPAELGAAGFHFITQFGGIDPLIRDGLRLTGKNQPPVNPLQGNFARTRENLAGLFEARGLARFGGAINIVGDLGADFADAAAGKARYN